VVDTKTVIIYESVYGSTHLVADELAAVAREHGEVEVVPAGQAGPDVTGGADLVLVGGPTHPHGLSTRATRRSGTAPPGGGNGSLGPDVPGPGLRDWFRLSGRVDGTAAAAFDTRLDGPDVGT
jgi:hypothetical protein